MDLKRRSQILDQVVSVFIENPFEMRLLNQRMNSLLRTFVLILVVVFFQFSGCFSFPFTKRFLFQSKYQCLFSGNSN